MPFFDLNVPITVPLWPTFVAGRGDESARLSKKQKAKQKKAVLDLAANVEAKGKQREEAPVEPLERISASQREELRGRVRDLRDCELTSQSGHAKRTDRAG